MAPNLRFDSFLRGASTSTPEDSDDERSSAELFQSLEGGTKRVANNNIPLAAVPAFTTATTAAANVWGKLWKERQSAKTATSVGAAANNGRAELLTNDDVDHVELEELEHLRRALSDIRILDSPQSNHNSQWLIRFHGELHDLPLEIVERVKDSAPHHFAGRVADLNENLLYEMQTQRGLAHLGVADRDIQKIVPANEYLGSYLTTEATVPQPAHVDYTWQVLEDVATGDDLSLGFFPLTNDGAFLQVWERQDDPNISEIPGELVFIPYGKLLVLPASTIHGGGFRTTPFWIKDNHEEEDSEDILSSSPSSYSSSYSASYLQDHGDDSSDELVSYQDSGNLRFHLYMARGGRSQLPAHQTNKYTEPNDKRRELCERYVDAPHMEVLQQHLFV